MMNVLMMILSIGNHDDDDAHDDINIPISRFYFHTLTLSLFHSKLLPNSNPQPSPNVLLRARMQFMPSYSTTFTYYCIW